MSDEIKTITFLAVALVCGIVAYSVSREAPEKTGADEVGNAFVEIEDPLEVTRLKIVKFNADEGKSLPFEVAKVDGSFSIPSHEDYPADQSDHLVNAVTAVSNPTILASVGDSAGTHEDYGVVDPTDEKLGKGAAGVGTRITLTSADGTDLSDFIIGKEVQDAEGQYYVRHADNDHVYTVELKPDELSTKFEDWIERDLLKLDPLDLTDVSINDYAVITEKQLVLGPTGLKPVSVVVDLDMKSAIDVKYDQKDLKWQLEKLVVFERGAPKEEQLADDEELNKSTLDDLKTALDDLKIVDVHRKPKGLGNDLQEFIKANPKAAASLEERGFYFRMVQSPDGKKQSLLLSNNGEITVGMADGVQYVLRFGNVAGAEQADEAKDDDGSDDEGNDETDAATDGEAASDTTGDDDGPSGKVLRNLLVITEFEKDLIEVPEYEEVPPEQPPAASDTPDSKDPAPNEEPPKDTDPADTPDPATDPAVEQPPTNEKPAGEKPADEKPADDVEPAEDPASKSAEDTASEAEGSTCDDVDETAKDVPVEDAVDPAKAAAEPAKDATEPAKDATEPTKDTAELAKDAAEPAKDAVDEQPAAGDTPNGDVTTDEPEPKAATDPAATDPATSEDAALKAAADAKQALEDWTAKRDGIIKENERKKKDYEEKIVAGKKRVEELNARFADWYYVIPDETFRKIHLARTDVVKKKEKTEEEKEGEPKKDSIQQFDDLKNALPPEDDLENALPPEDE